MLLINWGVRVERIQPVQLTRGPEQQLLTDLLALVTPLLGNSTACGVRTKSQRRGPETVGNRKKTTNEPFRKIPDLLSYLSPHLNSCEPFPKNRELKT